MAVTINGSGTVTGISAGGLPDGCVVTADVADGAITQQKRSEQLTLATAQASTSGTSIDFTGIPSWAKRVTVMFSGISTNGSSYVQIQIGSGSFTTSGYAGSTTSSNLVTNYNAGFIVHNNLSAAVVAYSTIVLVKVDGNTWLENHSTSTAGQVVTVGNGGLTLSGTLDRIRITTVNGTDTFDAGSINIMYE